MAFVARSEKTAASIARENDLWYGWSARDRMWYAGQLSELRLVKVRSIRLGRRRIDRLPSRALHGNAARTFIQARTDILVYLGTRGWTVSPHLKVPHATSPSGALRLWFKSQAVWASEGNHHTLGGARSTWIGDIRTMDGPAFLAAIGRMYGRSADRKRTRFGHAKRLPSKIMIIGTRLSGAGGDRALAGHVRWSACGVGGPMTGKFVTNSRAAAEAWAADKYPGVPVKVLPP